MLTATPGAPRAVVSPLPELVIGGKVYKAMVSDPYGYSEHRGRLHAGVDLTYQRRRKGDLPQFKRPLESSRGGWYFAPNGLPVVATEPGRVSRVSHTHRGWSVVIAHTGRGRATWYQHLAGRPHVVEGQLVAAGTELGVMGNDPSGGDVNHLHFELWLWDPVAKLWRKVDPAEYLAGAPPARVIVL